MNSKNVKSRYGWPVIILCLAVLVGLILFIVRLNKSDNRKVDAGSVTATTVATPSKITGNIDTTTPPQGEDPSDHTAPDRNVSQSGDTVDKPLTEPQFEGLPYGRYPDDTPLERVKRLIAPHEAPPADRSHLIRVFLDKQIVGIYTVDSHGDYTVPVHYFPCSTGIEEGSTPTGNYSIGIKYPLGVMIDMSYSHYLSQITGYIYFHSMPSYDDEQTDVPYEEFNLLGIEPSSHGCIRMTERDSKWIFDYMPEGTPVEVLASSEAFPDLPEEIDVIRMPGDGPSWDPTNPDPNNPYQQDPSSLLP